MYHLAPISYHVIRLATRTRDLQEGNLWPYLNGTLGRTPDGRWAWSDGTPEVPSLVGAVEDPA